MSPTVWLKSLQVAIINKDTASLKEISQKGFPSFETKEQLIQAQALILQAQTLLKELSQELNLSMQATKKMKLFHTSTHTTTHNLDNYN